MTLLYPQLRRPATVQRIGSLTGVRGPASAGARAAAADAPVEAPAASAGDAVGAGASTGGGLRSLPPDLDPTHNFLKNRFKFKVADRFWVILPPGGNLPQGRPVACYGLRFLPSFTEFSPVKETRMALVLLGFTVFQWALLRV